MPEVNKKINDLVYIVPGSEEKTKGMLHGKIAVILESLGQSEAAKQHWQQVSILLHIPEKSARVKFVKLIKNMMRNNLKK